MKIRLEDDIRCQATYNSLLRPLYQKLKHNVEDPLNKQWISDSHSEYSSPVVAVRKRDDRLRLCCDYRKLKAKTIPDHNPLPRIQGIIDSLGKNQYFSLLDQTKTYHQLLMDLEGRKVTAFLTPWGFYERLHIPFGLMNAPACFQRFIECCLGKYRNDFVIPYLDDLLVYSGSFEAHLKHVRLVLQRLENMALRLRHLCQLFKR